jgi:UDP-N-acetylglucosamine diphosphorylase/glucosamine-1-phosphate N-acetyltransferase
MTIVLFEDERTPQLYPISVSKPAFSITCGSYRLLERVESLQRPARLLVRPHLRGLLEADRLSVGLPPEPTSDWIVFVNARLVPSVAAIDQLRTLVASERPAVLRRGSVVLAAVVPAKLCPKEAALAPTQANSVLSQLPLPPTESDLPLFDYPHDVIRHHLTTLAPNLEHRLRQGHYEELADGVFAATGARLGQYVVTDTTGGPIVLDQGASIGPYCYLSGPAYLGAGARVIEQAAIKGGAALGHTTKIGGEVEGSIIEPYTNKQHHGFLGHSYLGSWVNLGAGTCNSDLKNTYGFVNMEYQGQKVATGMQFIGCIVGDYAKTAINTGIFTGKTIGACSMLYGFVTTNVPSFVNYARSFGQVTEAPVEVMVATQARMFARRHVDQRPCDIQLLHDMYELTRHERQLAGEPLAL